MKKNLLFYPSLVKGAESNSVLNNKWEIAEQAFENGNFKEAIQACIHYIKPEITPILATETKIGYTIAHGSIVLHLTITADELIINAPFLNIETAKKIPILRQIAQLNFSPLLLSRIQLENQNLVFHFAAPLELCEPNKLYEVLKEICINADNYDDEFIEKFNAKRIVTPKVNYYPVAIRDTGWDILQQYISEFFILYEQLEIKRQNVFLWDLVCITILKIDFLLAPQGLLRNEIEKIIVYLNSKEDYERRLSEGKSFLKKLQNIEKHKLEESLYTIDTFISYKLKITKEGIKAHFKSVLETADKELKSADFLGALFTLEYGILNLFYIYNVDSYIAEILSNEMKDASEKSIEIAAKQLFKTIENSMSANDSAKQQMDIDKVVERKNLFSKWFN